MVLRVLLLLLIILPCSAIPSIAQTAETKETEAAVKTGQPADPAPVPTPTPRRQGNFIKNSLRDQKTILTSPVRIKRSELKWVVPFGAALAALMITDRKTSTLVARRGSLSALSHGASYGGGLYATAGFATGLYLLGGATNDARLKTTGKLAFEALLGTGVVIGVLKHTTSRMRPNAIAGSGDFFDKGGRSFPSGHSSNAWAVATVIASEYKEKKLVRYGAIAAAIVISMSRYTGRAHFMSEVVVGSAIGIGIGRFVYKAHR
ncbi:MAG: phosphatase PAP2 family protein [Acidobacteriota bacterium]